MPGKAEDYFPAAKEGARWYPENMVVAPPVRGKYYFVDGTLSASGDGLSWEHAFRTPREAVVASTSRNNDVIFIAPRNDSDNSNRYDGNIKVDKRGIKIFGVGSFKSVVIRASAGTLVPFSGLDGVNYLGIGMYVVSTATDVEIAGLQFDASGVYCGLYWGDGYRINATTYAGGADTENGSVHNCTFKYGTTGLYYDGASNDHFCTNNYFYRQADNGVYIGPGGTQSVSRVYILDNLFAFCEDYGVFTYSAAGTNHNHIIGRNIFASKVPGTTDMTPFSSTAGTSYMAVVGNWMATDTDHALGTLDTGSGNFVGTKNTSEHVAED